MSSQTRRRAVIWGASALGAIALVAVLAAVSSTHGQDKAPAIVVTSGVGTNSALTGAGEAGAASVRESVGSGSAEVPPGAAVAKDAAVAVAVDRPDDDKARTLGTCIELAAAQDWQGLRDCADTLDKLGVKDKAAAFKAQALKEQDNELKANTVRQLIRDHNLKEAQSALAKIGDTSVYYMELSEALTRAENAAIDSAIRKAQASASAHDCAALRAQYKELAASSTARVAGAIAPIKCTENVVPAAPPPRATSPAAGSAAPIAGAAPVATAPPPAAGDCTPKHIEETMEQASHQYGAGFAKIALTLVVRTLTCKQDLRMYRIAAMYACAAKDLVAAKRYHNKLPPSMQSAIVQRCQQEGLDVRTP
jgi:hypothetical protein